MDAALYGHRHTMAYLHEKPAPPKAKRGSQEHYEALERRLEELSEEDEGTDHVSSYYE
jgi:hypothetical protein